MPLLLIVDDEENVLYSFTKGLANPNLEVITAEDGEQALAKFEDRHPDVVILDVRLPDMSGLEVFDRLRQIDSRVPVIVVTAHATTDTAIDAMKRGAFEYLIKPIDIHQLRASVAKAIELSRLQQVPTVFADESDESALADRIVGRSEPMQQVYKTIGRVARENVTVLVLGESGTGKELVARAIYHHSRRVDKPFLAINCAALPEPLLESELFGHERGAFTGATQRRIGKFEQAHRGTLFLDELGDMSLATQAKILRVMQDGRFERLGGSETIETDVRVIAATNHDLEARIETGEFRRDLLYRLNGFTLRLPPLRDRLEDLSLLVEYFIKQGSPEVTGQAVRISPEALEVLKKHSWPGNVRELQSAIQYALVHAVGEVIVPECLPENCHAAASVRGANGASDEQLLEEMLAGLADQVRRRLRAGETDLYRALIEQVDRVVLQEVLQHEGGNQVRASERLGMSRTTLRTKISNLGLS